MSFWIQLNFFRKMISILHGMRKYFLKHKKAISIFFWHNWKHKQVTSKVLVVVQDWVMWPQKMITEILGWVFMSPHVTIRCFHGCQYSLGCPKSKYFYTCHDNHCNQSIPIIAIDTKYPHGCHGTKYYLYSCHGDHRNQVRILIVTMKTKVSSTWSFVASIPYNAISAPNDRVIFKGLYPPPPKPHTLKFYDSDSVTIFLSYVW